MITSDSHRCVCVCVCVCTRVCLCFAGVWGKEKDLESAPRAPHTQNPAAFFEEQDVGDTGLSGGGGGGGGGGQEEKAEEGGV